MPTGMAATPAGSRSAPACSRALYALSLVGILGGGGKSKNSVAGALEGIHLVSIVGRTAGGFVFAVVALLFFFRSRSAGGVGGEPPGLKEALKFVQGLPYGQAVLAALGAGLVAFAVYSLAEARWRQRYPAWARGPARRTGGRFCAAGVRQSQL